MVQKRQRSKRPVLPSHSRPPTVKAKSGVLSSKATRNLIRTHHELTKSRAQAVQARNDALIKEIDAKIETNGGLQSYQHASKLGQSLERGGDSSRTLVEWISPRLVQLHNHNSSNTTGPGTNTSTGKTKEQKSNFKLRVLEVGALSTKNACSTNQFLDCTRIDLNSQESGILQQDFMERPLPRHESERFHLISLSLVLNYVPSASGRGDMLKRCLYFLTTNTRSSSDGGSSPENESEDEKKLFFPPGLFLVLPAACIDNSRYLTERRLSDIMSSLGFVLARSKRSAKLIFQLWELSKKPNDNSSSCEFGKEILNPGKTRNNFAIVVRGGNE